MQLSTLLTLAAIGLFTGGAQAQVFPTTPNLLVDDSLASPSGSFEWDNFTGPVTGSFSPDVISAGTGTADLSLTFTPQPFDGPPTALITSTSNIYAGGTLVDYTAGIDGAANSEAFTTVVAQVATLGTEFSDFLLNGLAPTEFVDRGIRADVLQGEFGAPFDVSYLWFEWQLSDTDVSDSLDFTFGNTVTHQSLTQVRIDYVNSDTLINATTPSAVPEPASVFLLGIGAVLMHKRRRRAFS